MYSSSYSQAKFGLEAKEPMHKPTGKSCGYYMRLVFFFCSLIQSLIIVSLVLFLVYGQPEKSAEEKRVQELELNFNRVSENNIQLRKEKGELGAQLGARTAEKAALETELAKLKTEANNTKHVLNLKLTSCESKMSTMLRRPNPQIQPPLGATTTSEINTLKTLNARHQAMINLIESNFTQTVLSLSQEKDNALREKDTHLQDATTLRKENRELKEQLITYTRKCKQDFAHSLDGIQTVTSEFLNKINNLFPHQLTFHLSCHSQQLQMEKIRNSCTNLSRDVETKFQLYLDNVGNKVAEIQSKSSRLEVQNSQLTSDLQQCEHKHSETVAEANKQQQLKQKTHDDQMEKILIKQEWLREQNKLQEGSLAQKDKEIQRLLSAQPNVKAGVSQATSLQASIGVPGISKTPTVR